MKKILVVYYSQSGQLKKITDNVVKPLKNLKGVEITYAQIKPLVDYPYPWGEDFFNCFPETVKGIPCKLQPFDFDITQNYDLIILAFQSWFLSPSIPMSSFLQSKEASLLLKDKKVITLQGVRNMWAAAQEIVKTRLAAIGADLVGNIILADATNNYISAITIINWMIYGKKGPSWLLPEAGVSSKDIENSSIFGEIISAHLLKGNYENLQSELILAEGVKTKYHLISIEFTARRIFDKFADYVLKKGKAGDVSRKARIRLFKWYLLFVFFIVSPIASLFYILKGLILFSIKRHNILYYEGIKQKN
jgi:hypothetical protein